jgi:hypothetical protein
MAVTLPTLLPCHSRHPAHHSSEACLPSQLPCQSRYPAPFNQLRLLWQQVVRRSPWDVVDCGYPVIVVALPTTALWWEVFCRSQRNIVHCGYPVHKVTLS